MFKSKEEKNREQEEFEKQLELEKEKEAQEEVERWRKRQENFCKELDEEMKNNNIVCIATHNVTLKQVALNHISKSGCWSCVQNESCCTRSTVHYILTFVRNGIKSCFDVK